MLLIIVPIVIIALVATMFTVNYLSNVEPTLSPDASSPLIVTSPAFTDGGKIPVKYTGDGENFSPPLKVENLPEGAQTLVVIVDDRSVPLMTWNHWVIWNIPANSTVTVDENTALGIQGKNSWRNNAYGGPDPPFGSHTYTFKAYALDITLSLNSDANKGAVLNAMNNHVLAKGQLSGIYP